MKRFIKRQWTMILILLIVLGGGGTYLYCGLHMPVAEASKAKSGVRYHCPMHPTYISNRPGDCPICGMRLVPIEEGEGGGAETAGALPAGPTVAGQAAIYLTPEKRQLIGVHSEPARRIALSRTIRTVGQVIADETRISRVYTKVGGWVEKLYVNFTGTQVRKGQPLLSIYSPELVATQEEYLLALRGQRRLSESSFGEVSAGGDSLLAATRRRLELWDVPESEIRRIERTGHPIKSITLYSPASGYVMTKSVLEGQRVDPSTELMVVADLSEIWVEAEFYESEAELVHAGQKAQLTVNSYPDHEWTGAIDYVYPSVDAQTRTLRARLRFRNHGLMLKPGMYVNVTIERPLGEVLAVPQEAVLDTGTRQIVFVDRGDGHFEPREVTIGQRTDGYREVVSGLSEGEPVVTDGNFLIDSESRLKSALQEMASPSTMGKPDASAKGRSGASSPQGAHAGHGM